MPMPTPVQSSAFNLSDASPRGIEAAERPPLPLPDLCPEMLRYVPRPVAEVDRPNWILIPPPSPMQANSCAFVIVLTEPITRCSTCSMPRGSALKTRTPRYDTQ